MRLFFIGPRLFGVRPGVSIPIKPSRSPIEETKNHVYVIRGQHGMSKIGVSTNPASRLATLQTGSAHPLEFAYVASVKTNALAVEQKAHAMLSKHRVSGEWFDIPPEMAVGALNAAANALGDVLMPVGVVTPPEPNRGEMTPPEARSPWPLLFVIAAPVPLLAWIISELSNDASDVVAYSVGTAVAYVLFFGAAKLISKII